MSSPYTFRAGKRLMMVLGLMTCLFLFAFHQANTNINHKSNNASASNTMCHNIRSLNTPSQQTLSSWKQRLGYLTQPYYRDLNTLDATSRAIQNQERILVLTPLLHHNAAEHLSRYFELLDQSTYPNHLISIGLLVSPSSSESLVQHEQLITTLMELTDRLQRRWFHSFHEINIYQRDFHFDFDSAATNHHSSLSSSFNLQPYRRSIMARARNYLLSAALEDDHSWVAWIDVDVKYPPTIFEDLMRHNVDVIVPNCLLPTADNSFWAYDLKNWQETDGSMRFQMSVGDDFVMVEGYKELATGRTLLVNMPTHLGHDHLVPLDGVGATFTLVKAIVHREGANFPSFAFQHQVDTEGFAKMAKAMGFGVFGIPSYFIYHAS